MMTLVREADSTIELANGNPKIACSILSRDELSSNTQAYKLFHKSII